MVYNKEICELKIGEKEMIYMCEICYEEFSDINVCSTHELFCKTAKTKESCSNCKHFKQENIVDNFGRYIGDNFYCLNNFQKFYTLNIDSEKCANYEIKD